MKVGLTRWMACAALASLLAAPGLAQKKEQIIQLQRDVALLQEAIRQSDRNTSEKIAALEALLKQNLDATTRLNQAIAVIERAVNKQSDAILPPVTQTAAKVDALTEQFAGLRDAVEESNAMISRLKQEIADIKTQLTTLPPPAVSGTGAEAGEESGAFGDSFFTSAVNDYHRGNYELAKAQFSDFLRYSGDSARAPEAQFYLGAIAYDTGDYEQAVKEFDLVLEKYPVGLISSDAQYKKAMALAKLCRLDEAKQEFQAVVDRFPNSTVAPNAKAALEEIEKGAGLAAACEQKPSPVRR